VFKLLSPLLFASILLAQGERGSLNGTITDPNGAAVPGATVTATSVDRSTEFKTTTTDAGVYRLPYLPAGNYRITASATGFRTSVAENVNLAVAQTLTVDLRMELGQVTEQVTVQAEAPLIETGTAEIGRYVSEREFDTWPIAVGDGRRQIQSFIFRSLPGTTGGEFQGSINGGQQYSHEILIEGMALGRFDLQGGSNNEFSPSAETISEFKLQTGTIGAQYGGGQTAVANFAVKSGTNELHGSAYDYIQNDVLRANSLTNNALGRKRPPYKLNNYGGAIGGPVYIPKLYDGRNRTFFFTNYERTRVRDFNSIAFTTLPTTDMKRGDFSSLLNPAYTGNPASGTTVGTDPLGRPVRFGQIYDPRTTRTVNGQVVRDPFPNNIIPQSAWSGVSRNIVNEVGIDDPVLGTLFNNMPNLSACCPVFDEHMFSAKVDHNLGDRHRVAAFFNMNHRQRNNSPGGRWGAPPGRPTNVYQNQYTPGRMVRLAHDWTVSASIINHLALGYNRFGNLNESVHVDEDWASKIGLQNTAPTTFPALTFSGSAILGGTIGANAGGGNWRLGSESRGGSYNGSTILQDDLTIVRGKHNFKLGTEIRFYYYNFRNKSGTGTFNFQSVQTQLPGFNTNTGHAFASFLLGAVNNTSRAISPTNPGFRTRVPAFYFSDDWKVTRKLTLNLGLRWEIIGGIYEVAGRMVNMDPSLPNPAAGNIPGALVWAEDVGQKGFQNTNWKQLSPRMGFAYAFSEKFVMRGGYGINNMAPVANFNLPSTFGYNGTINLSPSNTALQFPQDPVMYLDQPYPNFAGTLPNKNPALGNGIGQTFINPDATKLGYMQNYNLGIQYQLPQNLVLDVSFIGNKGTNLISSGLDAMNQLPVSALQYGDALLQPLSANPSLAPLPYPGFTGTLAQALRRFPQYQGVNQYLSNFGLSNYNSLQVTATRHFTKGLAVLAAYTYSKAIADVLTPVDGGISAQDVYNRGLERSVTEFNIPNNFKLTWIAEIPVGKGRKYSLGAIGNAILGGWNLTGIHNYRSGSPISVSMGGFRSDALFNGTIRPDYIPGVDPKVQSGTLDVRNAATSYQYLNPAAFQAVPLSPNGVPLRLGTAPRYLPNVRGPHFFSEDFGIEKRFPFLETRAIEFRADAFNAFNRSGLGGPNTDVTSPLFGKITGPQQGPRNIQLSLRVDF
jgi:hypothetical protein